MASEVGRGSLAPGVGTSGSVSLPIISQGVAIYRGFWPRSGMLPDETL